MAVDPILADEHEGAYLAALQATTPGQLERARAARKAAAALVMQYCPSAPLPVLLEATVRAAGYLVQIRPGSARQVAEGNVQRSLYIPKGLGALRSSGAMALLSPWKVRRAL